MPRAKHALPPENGKLRKRRRTAPPPPLSPRLPSRTPSEKYRPLNVDVPDAVLPRRYKRHAVLIDELDLDKFESNYLDSSSESTISLRPSSEFPARAGQTTYVGSRTPHFYLESLRNLLYKLLRRSKNDNRRSYAKKRRGFLSNLVRDWMIKRRKKRWIEARRDNKEDTRIFRSVFDLVDQRYRGGRIFYREESINTYVYHRVKFDHIWRKVAVLDRDLYLAAKEMQYELEFEDARRNDDRFSGLFRVIDKKYGNARVMYKMDKYGRKHVKVEHPICGFRVCDRTTQDAIDQLCNLYRYEIGTRQDRKMKRWRDIFDAIELYYPDSKLFYNQVSHGQWHAKVVHEVEGEIASGKSYNLDYTLEQVRNELEDVVEDLQDTHGRVGRWRC